tara:strand:- start:199 stop:1146 length:948 start_codon:yes stop_codon:yes gene_type:complete
MNHQIIIKNQNESQKSFMERLPKGLFKNDGKYSCLEAAEVLADFHEVASPRDIWECGLFLKGLSPENLKSDIIPWEGINIPDTHELLDMVLAKQDQMSGDFHAWCRHKKTGKILDIYNDPTTPVGKTLQEIMILHKCDEIVYEEFEKTPKYLERMLSEANYYWKNTEWYKKYRAAQDYSGIGYCFQRAHALHKLSPKNQKIKFGEVYIENKQTGVRLCIEGNNHQIVEKHIKLVKLKVLQGKMSKKKAIKLLTFFMTHSQDLMEDCVDTWIKQLTHFTLEYRSKTNMKLVKVSERFITSGGKQKVLMVARPCLRK